MPRPTSSVPGGPVAKIEVPPWWYTNIILVSRQSYPQLARLRYSERGVTKTRQFTKTSGTSNSTMKDTDTGSETYAIPPLEEGTTIDLTFFHLKSRTTTDNEPYSLSSRLYIVPVSKSRAAPKGMADYSTFFIFVEDTPSSNHYDDVVATVHMVECDPQPGRAVFVSASKAIGDFQFSTGVSDEELVPPPLYTPPPPLAKLPVGIIGAGAAGLYTAMILDSLDIKYEILEGSGRHGGRLYTHNFSKLPGPYQYFDAGAMRYPDIDLMKRTFHLIRNKLHIDNKLKDVIMYHPKTFLHFNGIRTTKGEYQESDKPGLTCADTFKVGITATNKEGYIPEDFLRKGHKALYNQALEPLRQLFVKDTFTNAFKELMKFDMYSVRDYMTLKMEYPNSVVRWIETMEWRTGMFDTALTETVLADLAFEDPRNKIQGKESKWFCLDGGSQVLADALLNNVKVKPVYYHRVTAIKEVQEDDYQSMLLIADRRDDPRIVKDTFEKKYSNVICTLPLSVIRTVDLEDTYLSIGQRNALRELLYSPSVKVGIQFKTPWWEDLGIVGGQSHTDRPARSVVYPSYGPGVGGGAKSNVLIASYNGMQDSQRLGALMKGRDSSEEKILLNLIMNDLAAIHNFPIEKIWEQYVDYYAWDWYSSSFSLGAFAWFGPGQFRDIYPHLTMPASRKQRLFFAGDATSASHGWVAGALNSAWRCVFAMLAAHPELNPHPGEDIIKKFTTEWGSNEEWDDRVLEKHVYLGRILTERRQAQSSH